ncbi:MAG: DMT family transporter [Chloroflexi bacterium]|nr:DMT family transporter [Chloroflexota bacterium]
MNKPAHTKALLLAIFITFLWSTSWILIKFGLRNDLPSLSFAGLRYTTAFLCLAIFVFANPKERANLKRLTRSDWGWLALLGLIVITLTQGAQFVSLAYLPANMVSLILNTTSIFVGLTGIYFLKESPSRLQWLGIALTLAGVGVYFLPISVSGILGVGLLAAILTMLGNTASSLLGRKINLQDHLSPLIVTFVSMGVGSVVLLVIGAVTQGLGQPSLADWGIIAWLAILNTAFAFTVWNHTLQTLTAVESSIINSLMMPQIAIMAWLFLGEAISSKEILGLILVGVGALVVQLRKR